MSFLHQMNVLQAVAGLILVGYVVWLLRTPRTWKPREQDVDEYLRRIDPDYTPSQNKNLR